MLTACSPTDANSPAIRNEIRITVANLPQPFATQSASKPPNVIPIPQNPTLRVPPGFVVNVFADNLDAPRWLAITANGDVLVTETRQNRIRLLRDTNGDGIADGSKTFARYQNGLNIRFKMAFADNYFFLGNTDAVLRFAYQKGQEQITGNKQKITHLNPSKPTTWGRPVGLLVLPDGSLLFTEEANNRIYRVQYRGS